MSEPTAKQVLEAVLIAQDQIARVQGEALNREDIASAIESGIRAAVSDPALWSAAVAAMRAHARQEAGTWLFSGLGAAFSKLAWVLVIGLGVYLLGGWSALASFIKSGVHQ